MRTMKGSLDGVVALAKLDGGLLASAYDDFFSGDCDPDKSIKVWNVATGHCLRSTKLRQQVGALAALDGGALAITSYDKQVNVWMP